MRREALTTSRTGGGVYVWLVHRGPDVSGVSTGVQRSSTRCRWCRAARLSVETQIEPCRSAWGAAQDQADAVTVDAALAARGIVRLRIESGALAQDSRWCRFCVSGRESETGCGGVSCLTRTRCAGPDTAFCRGDSDGLKVDVECVRLALGAEVRCDGRICSSWARGWSNLWRRWIATTFLPLDTAKHVQLVISLARQLMSTPRSQDRRQQFEKGCLSLQDSSVPAEERQREWVGEEVQQ